MSAQPSWSEIDPLDGVAITQGPRPLLDEVRAQWRAGHPFPAREVLQRHPAAASDRNVALRLIFEELCLRQEAHQADAEARMLEGYPAFRTDIEKVLSCQRLFAPPALLPMPQAGDTLGEFCLLAELGRGARGRVFLAVQPLLADRPVVLKVTPLEGEEHRTLARLQHTHIVPLYSVVHWPEQNLRGLCMPYFGGRSLAAILRQLEQPPRLRVGNDLLEALRQLSQPAGGVLRAVDASGPVARYLRQASYVQAVCWIGVCLAGALQHAHERGFVHLDIKPDNILLTAEGMPMLLDFHLAQAPLRPGEVPSMVGGTRGYMAPEQRRALEAVSQGQPIPEAVDARADLYALGVVLHEALAADTNPQVSPGLRAILARCTHPRAEERYADAGQLAEDLRRHLADLPLLGVANRPTERLRKWLRRRRGKGGGLRWSALLVLAAAVVAAIFLHLQATRDACAERELCRVHRSQGQHHQAAQAAARGLSRLAGLPAVASLTEELHQEYRLARQGMEADQLHHLVERLRLLAGSDTPIDSEEQQCLAAACRMCWERRRVFPRSSGGQRGALEERTEIDLIDLVVLWTDLRIRTRAAQPERDGARKEALTVLDRALVELGPSPILEMERAALARALGLPHVLEPPRPTGRNARECVALGRAALREHRLKEAGPLLERAITLAPRDFWAHFYHGVCCHRRGSPAEALAAFHVCVSLAPDSAECYYNRGLAHAALKQTRQALADYGRALARAPRLAAAALNRGVLHHQQGALNEALTDLQMALTAGADPALTHFNLALTHEARGDRIEAARHARKVIQICPEHAEAQSLLARLERPR